ncbi:hypothetical protein ML401_26220 [Bradyrhizobium sp. 62B]|uniref:hypothetical protein n=1 Tax=Bradyrhizobium sp. 62B TaxID=2898442 RepID=UPI002557CB90|nr:hypothetical protein ML401_26220 [Bradyrhizobium sp. 62B]
MAVPAERNHPSTKPPSSMSPSASGNPLDAVRALIVANGLREQELADVYAKRGIPARATGTEAQGFEVSVENPLLASKSRYGGGPMSKILYARN